MSLHDAVRNGNVAEVRSLIATGSNVNQVDKLKRTPLHMAAWSGNREIMQILLRANANPTDKATDAFTPLHFTAQSQSAEASECIRLLVKANRSLLNMRITKGNKSALHLAASKGNEGAVLTLIELGADAGATTSSGQVYLDLLKSDELRQSIVAKLAESQTASRKDKARPDDNREPEKDAENLGDEEGKRDESIAKVGLKRTAEDAELADETA